eukprot:2652863-Rhodomonas_salina.2
MDTFKGYENLAALHWLIMIVQFSDAAPALVQRAAGGPGRQRRRRGAQRSRARGGIDGRGRLSKLGLACTSGVQPCPERTPAAHKPCDSLFYRFWSSQHNPASSIPLPADDAGGQGAGAASASQLHVHCVSHLGRQDRIGMDVRRV